MIYYSHDSSARKDAYWAQNFSVYSVLISAAVSYIQGSMTEFHSIIATELAGSPLTFYMAFYAIRSVFGNPHKMDDLMGKKHVWQRVIAVGTFCLWAIYLGFSIGRSHVHFSQGSCQDKFYITAYSFVLPFMLFYVIWTDLSHVAVLVLGIPLLLVVVAWGVAIFLRRETLWYRDHTGKLLHPGFWKVWYVPLAPQR
jgi:predicted membrane protein